jgi:spore germination protein GerM
VHIIGFRQILDGAKRFVSKQMGLVYLLERLVMVIIFTFAEQMPTAKVLGQVTIYLIVVAVEQAVAVHPTGLSIVG